MIDIYNMIDEAYKEWHKKVEDELRTFIEERGITIEEFNKKYRLEILYNHNATTEIGSPMIVMQARIVPIYDVAQEIHDRSLRAVSDVVEQICSETSLTRPELAECYMTSRRGTWRDYAMDQYLLSQARDTYCSHVRETVKTDFVEYPARNRKGGNICKNCRHYRRGYCYLYFGSDAKARPRRADETCDHFEARVKEEKND